MNGKDKIDEPDRLGRTALSWAAERGRVDVVELFLNSGAELERVDKDGRSPLSWAAEGGSLAVVKLMIERGANVNLKDNKGAGPLKWAYWRGKGNDCIALQKLLQKHGASRVREVWLSRFEHCLRNTCLMVKQKLLKKYHQK